jgi:hypothetical protein
METENDMENQEIDIENDHETTSAAHNMENQQRDIENDLETFQNNTFVFNVSKQNVIIKHKKNKKQSNSQTNVSL